MIAKQVQGSDFKKVLDYVHNKSGAKLIGSNMMGKEIAYDLILDLEILRKVGIVLDFQTKEIAINEIIFPNESHQQSVY